MKLGFKIPLSTALLLLGASELTLVSAQAFDPEYHFGAEAQIHRDTVTPSFFPVLNFGLADESTNDKIDADLRISPTHPKAFALTSKNFYYTPGKAAPGEFEFSFGRKLINWSKIDELWDTGEFEPLDAWDRLRSSSQGLTGIFADIDAGEVKFHFFGSYLFIPEITPNVVIENRRFVLENPQSIATAPQTYNLLNRPTPIGYELAVPGIDKIIFRPSLVASVESKKEHDLYGKVTYGYLPLNYFPVAMEGVLGLGPGTIDVTLHPRLVKHHLVDAETSYRWNKYLTSGIAFLFSSPEADNYPTTYTTTPLSNSYTWSPWLELEASAHLNLILSQIWTIGGLESDVGSFANADSSIFSSRILYRKATELKARYAFGSRRVKSHYIQAKYLHEYSIHADWVAADLVLVASPQLSFLIGGDVINAERSVSPDRGAEFLADLRTLDRVRIGVQYAF